MPQLLVCLGATAAQSIFGPSFRVTRERGKILSSDLAPKTMATVHPSSLLRQPDEESRRREYQNFVSDLRTASRAVGAGQRGGHFPQAPARSAAPSQE
jgi:uracil-DNA glycosylase